METLIDYMKFRVSMKDVEIELIKKHFYSEEIPPQTNLLTAGNVEQYIYFLDSGIVKGYQNIDGKIVVQHLVDEKNFFGSLDSFITQTPSLDYFETITKCKLIKISKTDFDVLQEKAGFFAFFVKEVVNEHLTCKSERVKDFQILSAKERYLKFINQYPNLALNVSIENIASFLGMEPQSLSRIRKQIAF